MQSSVLRAAPARRPWTAARATARGRPALRVLAAQHQSDAASRWVPLSTGESSMSALWQLNWADDMYYDVRGPSWMIQRVESRLKDGTASPPRRRPTQLQRIPPQNGAGLVWTPHMAPHGPVLMLEGDLIDVTSYMEVSEDQEVDKATPTIVPNTTVTGIVPVENNQASMAEVDPNLYVTTSNSPRRVKVLGFTCKKCGARNHNSINPLSYEEGTLAAQCGKCKRWHKITDHLGLFHVMHGDLFQQPSPIEEEDIPPSLRVPIPGSDFTAGAGATSPLPPFYWKTGDDESEGKQGAN